MIARSCGWCGTTVMDEAATNCPNCGGPLPLPPGQDPGPQPPPAPRTLPKTYRHRVLLWRNAVVLIGVIFTVFFCWTLIFPLIGVPMWYFGVKGAQRKLAALERGLPARAEITDVYKDTSVTMNGRSPWAVLYSFRTQDGRLLEGSARGWEPEHGRRRPGEPLWVVYVAEDPDQNAIWPPIR